MPFLVLLDVLTSTAVIAVFAAFAYLYNRWWSRYPADRADSPAPWQISALAVWATATVLLPAVTTLVEADQREWRVPVHIALNLLAMAGMLRILTATARRNARNGGAR